MRVIARRGKLDGPRVLEVCRPPYLPSVADNLSPGDFGLGLVVSGTKEVLWWWLWSAGECREERGVVDVVTVV